MLTTVAVTFDRTVSAPNGITFKNGFHMPEGTRFAAASSGIARDAATYENPDEFDGFRFECLRQTSAEKSVRYHFVSTNTTDSMSFRVGKHACPGRFFAATQIKLLVATLLLEYDMQFPADLKTRPQSIVFGHNQKPDTDVKILLKRKLAIS